MGHAALPGILDQGDFSSMAPGFREVPAVGSACGREIKASEGAGDAGDDPSKLRIDKIRRARRCRPAGAVDEFIEPGELDVFVPVRSKLRGQGGALRPDEMGQGESRTGFVDGFNSGRFELCQFERISRQSDFQDVAFPALGREQVVLVLTGKAGERSLEVIFQGKKFEYLRDFRFG
jgi:hypothetical protein